VYPGKHFQISTATQRGNKMQRFLVIIEKGAENYGAYAPDLLGCVAVGDTIEETEKNMREAMEMHIEGMLEDGEATPISQSTACYITIPMPNSVI
jgi:predicted RNase H-like HicB family nuclease